LYLSLFLMFTSPTALSTLSLHDALPIYDRLVLRFARHDVPLIPHPGCALHTTCDTASGTRRSTGGFAKATVTTAATGKTARIAIDRKSTRLNSSHVKISYAVFCLKKKKT